VEEGRRILQESALDFQVASSMGDAARRIAEVAGRA
jgi:succinyl-CoA synthetase beta subunit